MSFSDLLKKPLPSKAAQETIATESTEEKIEEVEEVKDIKTEEGDISDNTLEDSYHELDKDPDVKTEESDDDLDEEIEDLDDIDLSDLSDAELEEMEAELRDSDIDDVTDDVEPVELSAEEEREADDLMSLAGTTELIRAELNGDEQDEFFESARDVQIAVFEGFLLESDVMEVSDDEVVTEGKTISSRNVMKRDAQSWKNVLYGIAVNVSARAHNDPDFIRLQKVQKMRRVLKRKLQKKYHAEAVRRMRVYFNRLKSSKSPILAKLGKKVDAESNK